MPSAIPVRWAIVGCGRVAQRRVAPVFARLEGAILHAFCSRDAARAREFAGQFGAPAAHGSLDDLLADRDVDAVYVALPNVLHAPTAMRCLAAGKHVLCDKPLALSADEARAMAGAARKAGRTLSVLHQQRFHPANQRLLELIRTGALGRLLSIRIHIGFFYPPGDLWRLDPARSGGGAWMDLAPHALDMMLQCGGPLRVIGGRVRNLCFDYPVEDDARAEIAFESGAVGTVETSYCAHAYGGRIEAYGDRASYIADGTMQAAPRYRTMLRKAGDEMEIDERAATVDCFELAVQDFSAALLEGRPPRVSLDDALAVMENVDSLYRMARPLSNAART
ncbi:1,5-anhydro-D-fructose reductase [Phycisphaerae bacterium RAS2]|nr:1,5-anhydro-D-fructose reductase [Phycisphaerae bacterium RAS2]